MSECLLWMGLPLDGRGNEDQEYLDGWVAPGIGSHRRAGLVMLEWGDAWIGCFTPAACAAISRCGCLDGDAWMEMLGWGCLDEDAATGDGAHAALSRGGDASQGSCQSLEPAVAEA